MNRFLVKKKSIQSAVEYTVERSKDAKLYRKFFFFKKFTGEPVKIRYTSPSTIDLSLDVIIRYGIDVLKASEKLSADLQAGLEKQLGIKARTVLITVRDIYDEKQPQENSQGHSA